MSQRIEDYLKRHYQDLAGKVDYWMNKHENDLEMKTKDLHELKVNSLLSALFIIMVNVVYFQQNKASGLMKLEDLSKEVIEEVKKVSLMHTMLHLCSTKSMRKLLWTTEL